MQVYLYVCRHGCICIIIYNKMLQSIDTHKIDKFPIQPCYSKCRCLVLSEESQVLLRKIVSRRHRKSILKTLVYLHVYGDIHHVLPYKTLHILIGAACLYAFASYESVNGKIW